MNNTSSTSKVKVYIRCRPFLPQENISRSCITIENETKITVGDKSFVFDSVFHGNTGQESVYSYTVSPLIDGCLQGFNGTIFAYGQTGSGKTYSMVGWINRKDENDIEHAGVIPRSLQNLFQCAKEKENEGAVVNFRVSFIEIYNEEFRDLLHLDIPSREIMIREDKDGKIFFTGARDESVANIQQALTYLDKGTLSRTTAETLMNVTSSRSHAIFTISTEIFIPSTEISSTNQQVLSIGGKYVQSKLHIVDLAGSERAKRTGAGGLRLKESVGINQGLLSLGKVIRALTSSPSSTGGLLHIPYRESKLTRFLQDSLGGNSRTVMLACVSPAEINLHETLNTLQYASKARSVQNKVIANISVAPMITVDSSDNEVENNIIGALRAQIQKMHTEISDLRQNKSYNDLDYESSLSSLSPSKAKAKIKVIPYLLNKQELIKILRFLDQSQDELRNELSKLGNSISSHDCGIAWNLVIYCQSKILQTQMIVNKLEQIITSYDMDLQSSSSVNPFHKDVSYEDTKRLEQELRECKEDLKRDEEIFSEKVKELKACRKQIKQLERECDDLKSIANELKKSNQQFIINSGIHAQSSGSIHKNDNSNNDNDNDGLELSIAVAATEPDISQLMEDLETVSKDKEKLILEKEITERSYQEAMTQALEEKNEYERVQRELQDRLEELENQMESKQLQMQDLKESHHKAIDDATYYQMRLIELEDESNHLRSQLESLDQSTKVSAKEINEEKEKRIQYERQLAQVQDELKSFREDYILKDSKSTSSISRSVGTSRPSTGQISFEVIAESKHSELRYDGKYRNSLDSKRLGDDSNSNSSSNSDEKQSIATDLFKLQKEYQTLSDLYQQKENEQHDRMNELIVQLNRYKSNDSIVQARMKMLEDKNHHLRQRFEQWAQRKGYPTDLSLSSSFQSLSQQSPPNLHKNIISSYSMESFTPSTILLKQQKVKDMINLKVRQYVDIKLCFLDIIRLQYRILECDQDRDDLLHELQPYTERKLQEENHIKNQLKEVKRKLKSILLKIKELRASNASNPNEPIDPNILNNLLREAKSYQEHYDELSKRLSGGVVDSKSLNRIQEIQEEMEAVDTELQVHKHLLQQESDRLISYLSNLDMTSQIVQDLLDMSLTITRSNPQPTDLSTIDLQPFDSFLHQSISHHIQSFTDNIESHGSHMTTTLVEVELMITAINSQTNLIFDHNEGHQYKVKLEKKVEEYDELLNTLKRSRAELVQQQEDIRRESDIKIEYLLQQLRQAEDRINSILSHSQSSKPIVNHSLSNLPRYPSRPSTSDANYRNEGDQGIVLGIKGNSGSHSSSKYELQSSSSIRNASPSRSFRSMERGLPDNELISYSNHDQNRPRSGITNLDDEIRGDDHGHDRVDWNIHHEVLRRWQTEKERRMLLEKRTTELAKELRQLRQQQQQKYQEKESNE